MPNHTNFINNKFNYILILGALLLTLLSFSSGLKAKAEAGIFASENFSQSSTKNWNWGKGSTSEPPCLTGAPVGSSPVNSIPGCASTTTNVKELPEANGLLRLTSNNGYQSGFVYYNQPIPSGSGITFTFDTYTYGARGSGGADGFSFILFNGDVTPGNGGGNGGSLGYAQRSGIHGFPGGYVGIGFDEFGNYANDGEGRGAGCLQKSVYPGSTRVLNSVTIRGSGDKNNGYCFLKSTGNMTAQYGAMSFPNATRRLPEHKRKLKIDLSSNGVINVAIDFNNGKGFQSVIQDFDLVNAPGQVKLPPSLKFGFAASTGGSYSVHEVDGITVTSNKPDLKATQSFVGSLVKGSTARYEVAVANSPSAGSTNQQVNINMAFPSGIEPVSAKGDNWDSSVEKQVVDANYSKPIGPGDKLAKLNIEVKITDPPPDPVTILVVTNPDESITNMSNNVNSFSLKSGNSYSGYTSFDAAGGCVLQHLNAGTGTTSYTYVDLCVSAGMLYNYAADSIDDNDICAATNILAHDTVITIDDNLNLANIICDTQQNSIALSSVNVGSTRQTTYGILNDVVFDDARGYSLTNYTVTATVSTFQNVAQDTITIGTNPDGSGPENVTGAPTGNDSGKLFATFNCSAGNLQILQPLQAVNEGIGNYQKGSFVSLASTFAPATLLQTTDGVTPGRVDLDGCSFSLRIPAFARSGNYSGVITQTVV